MDSNVYIHDILEQHVKPMLDAGEQFIMEEDRDSAHTSKQTTRYKGEYRLKVYANRP